MFHTVTTYLMGLNHHFTTWQGCRHAALEHWHHWAALRHEHKAWWQGVLKYINGGHG